MVGRKGSAILAQTDGSFWMPPRASTTAPEVDWLFHFILAISAFFFVLILGLTLFFVIRYRRREGAGPSKTSPVYLPLELTWTIIPVIVVILIFWWSFKSYMNLRTPPEGAYEIQVTGQRWSWQFAYQNGYVDGDLHVPADVPVRLVMSSQDVIHSLFVPAFRLKMDAVPGRYTEAWFQADLPGEYPLLCAEYCGTGHSTMTATAIVHPPGEFEKWLEKASSFHELMSPAEAGRLLYRRRGCFQCHSVDGTANIGPTFKRLFGRKQALRDGSVLAVDENYVRESILEPQEKIVAGFEPVMPTYKGRLKDRDVTAIIEYIKTLRE